ncbi:sushi, von Willebrand factor type A, EGF and pentraxin domain-containing protein 1-like isoform X2 [Watersipora subatra]|uniref:sushi, von Willebrand factor type A, EGF and pentraxin domain-containing protein 1-like isoform X2 n=1 Tax=Watersipora subatra TaxID=2589382 RepID=UPI00355C69E6
MQDIRVLSMVILFGATFISAQTDLCTIGKRYLEMCKNGCNKFNQTSDLEAGVLLRTSERILNRCSLFIETEPGYGIFVITGVLTNIGSCGRECRDANYLSFSDGLTDECICGDEKLDPNSHLFATNNNILNIEYSRGEFTLHVQVRGCLTSDLITGSRAKFEYVSGSPKAGGDYIVNVTCPEGYLLSKKYLYSENRCLIPTNGRSYIGTWQKDTVKCRKARCAAPEVPENGLYRPYTPDELYEYGETIEHECERGYELVSGTTIRRCIIRHGIGPVFSGVLPVCKKKDCGEPSDIEHAIIDGRDTLYNATREVSCYNGYKLDGSPLTCQEDGSWSVAPSCNIIECPDPPTVPHSRYELRAVGPVQGMTKVFGSNWEFTCDAGFRLLGDAIMTCQKNGSWSTPPICTAEFCLLDDLPQMPVYECIDCETNLDVRVNATRQYKCLQGYVEQLQTIRCQRSGTWTNLNQCERVNCGPPEEVPHGNWQYTSSNHGDTASLICEQGFVLSTNDLLTCNQSGEWSNGPTCIEVDCGSPPRPQNGNLEEPFTTTYNSTVNYSCSKGYVLNGSRNFIKCQLSGLWTEVSGCNAKDCGQPGKLLIANGNHENIQQTVYGSTVEYSCDRGYMFTSNKNIVCQANGTWSSLPQCKEIDCAIPGNITSAKMVSHNGTGLGDIVTYQCTLYISELSGTCGEDGTWSYPSCPERSTDPMLWLYIGCTIGILIVIILFILIVGLCFRKKEKARRISEKTRSFYGRRKVNEKSVKDRFNRSKNSACSSDSGLSVGEQIGSEHQFSLSRYDYKQTSSSLMEPSRMTSLEASPQYSTNSLNQPRSRQPIANGVCLDMMTVEEVDCDIKIPLYGEQRIDKKGSRNQSSAFLGNSPVASVGTASPLLNNLGSREWEDNHSARKHNTLILNGKQGNIVEPYPSHSMDRHKYHANPLQLRVIPGQEVGRTEECSLSLDSQEVFGPLLADKQYPVYM